jgi:S-adenosylmethionine:tRNA ribosyltransferase-isomerase
LNTSDFDYHLPPERIAQFPIEPRDSSKLMRVDRKSGQISHHNFRDLPDMLDSGDLIVRNRTRVIPARLKARKLPGGGRLEVLLLERITADTWKCMLGGKGMRVGKLFELSNGMQGEVIAEEDSPQRVVRFTEDLDDALMDLGEMPMPPYIHDALEDQARYQTVFAELPGSAAAPTAGLHFTPRLFEQLAELGINTADITLHIGLDTFAPVREENVRAHHIHSEWCEMSIDTALQVQEAKMNGGRVVALGTTSVRTLESAAQGYANEKKLGAFSGRTKLFILPGFQFAAVDAMITNFHLPRSTLIMLVSAFAKREIILEAYSKAIENDYRFYSFGDAMLII